MKSKHRNVPEVISTIAEDGSRFLATSPSEIVKTFNQYFVSVFTQDADICRPDSVDEIPADPVLCDLTLTTNQVLAVLSGLNVKKACGPDELPARILRETAHEIAPSLCELFNKSLRLGSLPIDLISSLYIRRTTKNTSKTIATSHYSA